MEYKALKQDVNKGAKDKNGQTILVREFEPFDKPEVQRIFSEGLMEMIPDTAFRGLRHHPESLLLYAAMTVICFAITMCWWVIGLLPTAVVCMRYFYSRRVIHGYLRLALSRDMEDIEGFYMKSSGSCLWVAVLQGKVVGVVAAVGRSESTVELQRMCVDQRHRRSRVGFALGQKVLEFAVAHRYSSVVLGTTAYTPAAHQLYQRLGFHCVGVTNGYITPGARQSLLEQIFYRVRHHHYSLNVRNSKNTSNEHH
ncbi:N-acetylaspartate synthetase-like [Melanotaenia boesemani]|uniref:N-acetylaspartate synthetase-like n=1 Tax=Melanotaenia boesemani TaxID=1250792 RepID=UPI001C04F8BC|nr:N-acetylaspartate synthetase-like [Melanotaenia boesemani]